MDFNVLGFAPYLSNSMIKRFEKIFFSHTCRLKKYYHFSLRKKMKKEKRRGCTSSRTTASIIIESLMDRLHRTSDASVVLKCLITIHHIIKRGPFILQDQLSPLPPGPPAPPPLVLPGLLLLPGADAPPLVPPVYICTCIV